MTAIIIAAYIAISVLFLVIDASTVKDLKWYDDKLRVNWFIDILWLPYLMWLFLIKLPYDMIEEQWSKE